MTHLSTAPPRPALVAPVAGIHAKHGLARAACAARTATCIAALVWSFAAAAASGHSQSKVPTPADVGTALHAKVQRLIGPARCTADAQCRSLPLGSRACGGPDSFVAWSVRATDAPALKRAAQRYTLWQAQAQQLSGAQSICMVEVDPGATCVRPAAPTTAPSATGRCMLGHHAAGAVSR